MSGETQAKPRGRRVALPPDQRKRETFTFRVRTELRDRVEQLAEENGRSLSEEIEFRLEQAMTFKSICTDDFVAQVKELVDDNKRKTDGIRDMSRMQDQLNSKSVEIGTAFQNLSREMADLIGSILEQSDISSHRAALERAQRSFLDTAEKIEGGLRGVNWFL